MNAVQNLLARRTLVRGGVKTLLFTLKPGAAVPADVASWTFRGRFGADDGTDQWFEPQIAGPITATSAGLIVINLAAADTIKIPLGVNSVRFGLWRTTAGQEYPIVDTIYAVSSVKGRV